MNEARDFYINVNSGTILRFFLIAAVIAAIYYLSDVVLVILAAVVLASSFEPVIRRLKRYHLPRIISVVLIYVLIAAAIITIIFFFMPVILNDTVGLINNLPRDISLADLWSPIQSLGFNVGSVSSTLSGQTIPLSDFVTGLQSLITGTSAGVVKTASVVFGGVLSFILIIVISFYLSVQEEGVDDFLRIITPSRHYEYILNLWKRSQRRGSGLWLQGQILLGIVVGVLVYLILMVVGIPHALLLALLAAVFEIIPVFGPIISSVPAILVAFVDGGVGTGFLLIGLYLIVYQFESQLFYPLVVKKIVGISPIVVILALIAGAKLAGVLGALIAVPLSAALMEYLHDVEKRKRAETLPAIG